MPANIFSEIKNGYEFLTKTEKKIADCILNEPNRFTGLSITDLSALCGVSQGSINNFSKKLCGGGFSDLKITVAGCISAYHKQPFSTIDKNSGMKAALSHRISETAEAFRNTLEINDESVLRTVAEDIMKSERVAVFGVYQSGIVARDLCYQLIQLGIPASYQEDTLMGAVAASLLNKNCIVLAFSSSGETKEIIDAVALARENGAKGIGITSNKFSPLAAICDELLLSAGSGSSISDRYNEVRMSQMLLCDTLCSYIRSVIDESGSVHYFKMQKILCSHSVKND